MGRRRPPSKTTRSAATSSNVVPEVASESVAQNTTDTQEARRRTMRSNTGVCGRADQLRMIGQTLEAPLKTPRPVTTVPKDVPVNPMAPVQAKKRTRKQGAKNAGSLFPVCPFFPIFYCELNTVQQEDPLPRHDSDGSATGLPIHTLITGPPNSRFGFKLNLPSRPGYVGSQEIETFQKHLEKSLPTATPTAANRRQRVARTVASTPTVSNKHSRRQVHPTIDEPHSPLSELSEVPEEQLEDKRYLSDNGNSDQDLYNHPVNDTLYDNLYNGPVDGAFSAFDDPQADNDAMDDLDWVATMLLQPTQSMSSPLRAVKLIKRVVTNPILFGNLSNSNAVRSSRSMVPTSRIILRHTLYDKQPLSPSAPKEVLPLHPISHPGPLLTPHIHTVPRPINCRRKPSHHPQFLAKTQQAQ
ncbi:hypothetical protein JVT61DRAFT_7804 [Boletus reticuloceps]|uniref:Uncharacterized protein n=1 Tax=Boletus reticuloceps TaxID=495285 RepID=A0A8I2YHR4_9AGAM|nr:hypothetical protein JVT61DRAFT_7804 [Boletus reticuloceps]